jgi:hypothetical protein
MARTNRTAPSSLLKSGGQSAIRARATRATRIKTKAKTPSRKSRRNQPILGSSTAAPRGWSAGLGLGGGGPFRAGAGALAESWFWTGRGAGLPLTAFGAALAAGAGLPLGGLPLAGFGRAWPPFGLAGGAPPGPLAAGFFPG